MTDAAGDEILGDGAVSVGAYALITITLTATGEDGLPPVNGSDGHPAGRQWFRRLRE